MIESTHEIHALLLAALVATGLVGLTVTHYKAANAVRRKQ